MIPTQPYPIVGSPLASEAARTVSTPSQSGVARGHPNSDRWPWAYSILLIVAASALSWFAIIRVASWLAMVLT